jgi:GMP synthase (glutamine-hydrolysing)
MIRFLPGGDLTPSSPWRPDERKRRRKIALAPRRKGAHLRRFGACLGAQLLAASLGGKVFQGEKPEVGLLPVFLSSGAIIDPVFSGIPHQLLTFQWHCDTFTLPPGSVLLASSPAYVNQAFRWGSRVYGLQFHLEVSQEMAEEWLKVPEYAKTLNDVLGPGAETTLINHFSEYEERLRGKGRLLFERWLDLVG